MSQDQFRQAEEKFYLLKGQLATGRITQEQFDAELKNLMLQDAQGSYWMIGADTGKWYIHDGQRWVEAQPPINKSQKVRTTLPETLAQPQRSNRFPWILIGCAILLLVVITVGTFVAFSNFFPRTSALPTVFTFVTITPIPPVVVLQPTQVPVISTPIPPTSTPVDTPLPLRPIIPTASSTAILLQPSATPIPVLPTAILATPTTAIPPGVYVNRIRPEPPSLPPATDVSFWVTFLNTTGSSPRYKWKVYIYKPDNLKNSFGETSAVTIDMPAGSTEQSVGMWRITVGACGDYFARVGWLDDGNRITFFTRPDGQVYEFAFATCR